MFSKWSLLDQRLSDLVSWSQTSTVDLPPRCEASAPTCRCCAVGRIDIRSEGGGGGCVSADCPSLSHFIKQFEWVLCSTGGESRGGGLKPPPPPSPSYAPLPASDPGGHGFLGANAVIRRLPAHPPHTSFFSIVPRSKVWFAPLPSQVTLRWTKPGIRVGSDRAPVDPWFSQCYPL